MRTKQEHTRSMKAPARARKTTPSPGVDSSTPSVSVCDDLQGRIAARAHELYMKRGCGDGYALADWVQAEREILSQVPPV